jgi:hypothetical protein
MFASSIGGITELKINPAGPSQAGGVFYWAASFEMACLIGLLAFPGGFAIIGADIDATRPQTSAYLPCVCPFPNSMAALAGERRRGGRVLVAFVSSAD